MEIISTIKTDVNGNILDRHQIHYRGVEYRDSLKNNYMHKKDMDIATLNNRYAELISNKSNQIEAISKAILDEQDIDKKAFLETQKTTLLSELSTLQSELPVKIEAVNQQYLSDCAMADTQCETNRLASLQTGFTVIPNVEFDKIGSEKDLKLWDATTQTVVDKPTASATRLEILNNKRISDIKTLAGEVINNRYPLRTGKQNNMIARMTELLLTMQTVGSLTSAEQTELTELQAAWSWVKSVRTMSNQAEISGTNASDIVWPV